MHLPQMTTFDRLVSEYCWPNLPFLPPIRTIDFTSPADVARHDRMVALVERTAKWTCTKSPRPRGPPHVKTVLQRQIEARRRLVRSDAGGDQAHRGVYEVPVRRSVTRCSGPISARLELAAQAGPSPVYECEEFLRVT